VYAGGDSLGALRLWVRNMDELETRQVAGVENATMPFWSPDGRTIAYFTANTKLMKVPAGGGTPSLVIDNVKAPRGGSWSGDTILYAPFSEGPIYAVSANGGSATAITHVDSTETGHRFPSYLPDGKHFLYTALPPREGRYRIFLGSTDGKEKVLLTDQAGGGAVYAAPGYLLYSRGGIAVAQRFDTRKQKLLGEAVPLGDQMIGTGFSGAASMRAAGNESFAYTTNGAFATHLVWCDLNGKELATLPMAPGKYDDIEMSPDERHAVVESSPRIGVSDLWLADLDRGAVTRLSNEAGENSQALWSPDGARVVFTSNALGGYSKFVVTNVETGASETFLEDEHVFMNLFGWTPDGREIVYGRQEPKTRWDIWVLTIDGKTATSRPFLATPYFEDRGVVSPDGKWMAYRSNESDRMEIYVQAFPNGGSKYRVTMHGGNDVEWSADGRRLYYGSADDINTIYAADVLPGTKFALGPARVFARFPGTAFDGEISADGRRMLILMPARPLPPQSITVVQNWTKLLGRK
jgi:Tol biopolymer transport system component